MIAPRFLALAGASSRSDAANALVAPPVARPWMTRAAITQPILGAKMNITIEMTSTDSAATRTGRRPMKSESDPATRMAATRPMA
ncbi:MAG TPA: hypothetical protein VHU90_00300 [Galbitalea sp.]|nr:hypothetical protein [Galbitalea sp.]